MPSYNVPVTFAVVAESPTEAERLVSDYLEQSAFLLPSNEQGWTIVYGYVEHTQMARAVPDDAG
jgi:hypothetical protein